MCPGLGQIWGETSERSLLDSRFQQPLPQLVQEKQMMGILEHTVTSGQDDNGKNGISPLEVCEVFQKYLRSFSLSESVDVIIQVQEFVNPYLYRTSLCAYVLKLFEGSEIGW